MTSIDTVFFYCLITIYIAYWLYIFVEDILYRRQIENYIAYKDSHKEYSLRYNGFCWYFYDQELEENRAKAIEVANMSPYEFGYYSYWEGLELSEINTAQIGGYLDAKYEVECNNSNF